MVIPFWRAGIDLFFQKGYYFVGRMFLLQVGIEADGIDTGQIGVRVIRRTMELQQSNKKKRGKIWRFNGKKFLCRKEQS